MMRVTSAVVVLVALCMATNLIAKPQPASQPAPTSIEIRAQEEFGRANWGAALPLLNRVAQQLKDSNQGDRLGAIEEQIRVCQKNLATAAGAVAAKVDKTAPETGDNRKKHPAPKDGDVREMSIKELGNFEYDAEVGGGIPADVKALSGATVKLHGFMIPMDQADSITQFALVPSLFACCFGQPPQVQHTIVVHLPQGKGVSYFPDEITVQGKLTVDEKKEDGFIVSVFEVEASSVKPAAK